MRNKLKLTLSIIKTGKNTIYYYSYLAIYKIMPLIIKRLIARQQRKETIDIENTGRFDIYILAADSL